MSDLLRPGQVVNTRHGGPCQVEKFLGGGGQGEVYRAQWDGRPYALKWYYENTGTTAQRSVLEQLIETGPPSDRFLWPLELAQAPRVPAFGYLMPLREARYKSLTDLMLRKVDPRFVALVTAALQLVDSFRKLHAKGLCYRDISFGNAFFDPNTGDVLVCDNDNVDTNRTSTAGVLGTPDFMAPEIVRGEAVPSRQTDLFSLSVLLFYMFFTNHPLLGRRVLSIRSFDLPARNKLFGVEPLFIFDPANQSNEAVPASADPLREAGANALDTWPLFPIFLRDLFTRSFTDGLRDADNGRVTEIEWSGVLSRLRDSIFVCSCSTENFYDPDAVTPSGEYDHECWHCHSRLRLPYRIRIGRSVVMLNHDSKLFPHHLDEKQSVEFADVAAEVVRHPTDPNVWGLKNRTKDKWVATTPDGTIRDVDPEKSLVLAANTKVNFGRVEGEIRY